MKFKAIEIEMNAEELKCCRSVGDGIFDMLRGMFNWTSKEEDVEDEEVEEDDQEKELEEA